MHDWRAAFYHFIGNGTKWYLLSCRRFRSRDYSLLKSYAAPVRLGDPQFNGADDGVVVGLCMVALLIIALSILLDMRPRLAGHD